MKFQCVVAAVMVGSASSMSMYQDWAPRPASDLGSTAEEFGVQSVCEGQYMGSECSEKVCAFGLSSNASPFLSEDGEGDNLWAPNSNNYMDSFNGGARALADGGVHTYTECSSQGICDRTTGVCSCFDGYSGKGCRRTECPNDCSGHGMCSRNIDANPDYAVSGAPMLSYATQYWDGKKTMRCQCDRGYEGADCSDRICPHGDDVLTTCAADSNHDVQVITFTDADSDFADAVAADEEPLFYTLTFADHFGGVYKTRPIALTGVDAANARSTQAALEDLPNSAIPSVQVTASGLAVSVAFTDSATTGKQSTLEANIVTVGQTCTEGGQQPLTKNKAHYTSVGVSVVHQGLADANSNYEENAPCGNRGICDSSVGKCECFEGHTGEACEIQSVYV